MVISIKAFYLLCSIYFLSTSTISCARKPLSQKENITGFFEELLLEHGGAFTLLGSKPMTMEPLLDCSKETLEQITAYLKEHPEIQAIFVERKLEEGWDEWKKTHKLHPRRFLLTEITLRNDRMLVFMNIASTIDILEKYYDDFRQIAGSDFVPQKIVRELCLGNSKFWQKVLLDHKGKGILFGYGYRNSSLFEQQLQDCKYSIAASENNDPRLAAECYLNNRPFRIPIFAILDPDESRQLLDRYKKEREEIKGFYEGKDFLKATTRILEYGLLLGPNRTS